MDFTVIDYHKGATGKTVSFSTIKQLKKFAEENSYNAIWLDFKNQILWVTIYNKFFQK